MAEEIENEDTEKNVAQIVCDWIDGAGIFVIATENGDQPKARPMRSHFVIGDKIYFGTGRFKDVFKQMQENPKVELVAIKGGEFLRCYGTAVFEKTYDLAEKVLDKLPQARGIYTMEGDMKLEMFHLEDATVEIRNMMGVEESYRM